MLFVRLNWILTAFVILLGHYLVSPTPLAAQASLQRMQQINPNLPDPLPINEELVAAQGIRKLSGKFVTIYTDVRNRVDIEELPNVFDKAVPQWCEYFGIEIAKTDGWHVRAMVIADDKRFRAAGLIVEGMPEFLAGLQIGHEMWVYLQPGKYYTRHLLLHEGTHAFMQWFLNGLGAPWYTEGMAELLGIHAWNAPELKLKFRLTDRRQAEYWGRIKIIHDDRAKNNSMTIDEVFGIEARSFRDVRFYAWSWAACEFLSGHPLTAASFSKLKNVASQGQALFNRQFEKAIEPYRREWERDWKLFIDEIDFGYEISRAAVRDIRTISKNRFELDVANGWQVAPMTLTAGETIEIKTRGRFTVAMMKDGTAWPCESNGISIEYYRGRPLGQLLIGVLSKDGVEVRSLLEPSALPENGHWISPVDGNVCFRINESPARLDDNSGKLEIFVRKPKPQPSR